MMDGSSGWQPSQESRIRLKRRSLALNTHWELHFGEIRMYRLPSNHCRPRETDLEFEFPTSNYPWYHRCVSHSVSFPVMFFWPGYRQTNRQTNFYFVRPSFQSREKRSPIQRRLGPWREGIGSWCLHDAQRATIGWHIHKSSVIDFMHRF